MRCPSKMKTLHILFLLLSIFPLFGQTKVLSQFYTGKEVCPPVEACETQPQTYPAYNCTSDDFCAEGFVCCPHGCYTHNVCLRIPKESLLEECPASEGDCLDPDLEHFLSYLKCTTHEDCLPKRVCCSDPCVPFTVCKVRTQRKERYKTHLVNVKPGITTSRYTSSENRCPSSKECMWPKQTNENYRCEDDFDCAADLICCEHDCYNHKVCVASVDPDGKSVEADPWKLFDTKVDINGNSVSLDEVGNATYCPAQSVCPRAPTSDEEYLCKTDDDCYYGSKCCQHSCYTHLVCLQPIDGKGQPVNIFEDGKKVSEDSCPYIDYCPINMEHIQDYRCHSDEDCQDDWKCCPHSCYYHKVCLPPVKKEQEKSHSETNGKEFEEGRTIVHAENGHVFPKEGTPPPEDDYDGVTSISFNKDAETTTASGVIDDNESYGPVSETVEVELTPTVKDDDDQSSNKTSNENDDIEEYGEEVDKIYETGDKENNSHEDKQENTDELIGSQDADNFDEDYETEEDGIFDDDVDEERQENIDTLTDGEEPDYFGQDDIDYESRENSHEDRQENTSKLPDIVDTNSYEDKQENTSKLPDIVDTNSYEDRQENTSKLHDIVDTNSYEDKQENTSQLPDIVDTNSHEDRQENNSKFPDIEDTDYFDEDRKGVDETKEVEDIENTDFNYDEYMYDLGEVGDADEEPSLKDTVAIGEEENEYAEVFDVVSGENDEILNRREEEETDEIGHNESNFDVDIFDADIDNEGSESVYSEEGEKVGEKYEVEEKENNANDTSNENYVDSEEEFIDTIGKDEGQNEGDEVFEEELQNKLLRQLLTILQNKSMSHVEMPEGSEEYIIRFTKRRERTKISKIGHRND